MEALFLHKAFDARVAPFNLRERLEGEHVIKVAAVGLCGDAPRAFQLHAENAPGMIKSMIFPNVIE